ncbi:NADH kinase pos5, partial [Coemansia sp. RSA 1938]
MLGPRLWPRVFCTTANARLARLFTTTRSIRTSGILTTLDIPTKAAPIITRRLSQADDHSVDHEADQQFSLNWRGATPQTVLIIKKANDTNVDSALARISQWLHTEYPQINIVLEPPVFDQFHSTLPF